MSVERDWLTLCHQRGLGAAGVSRLIALFDSPSQALKKNDSDWQHAGLTASQIKGRHDKIDIADDLSWLEQENCHLVTLHDDNYPLRLKDLRNPPPILYVLGDLDVINLPQLAIVGSRNPTNGGTQTATDFAAHFARAGLTITSGLALGIDATAHQATLDANGYTVAVVGTGLDRTYPARNRELARNIAESGALVSEFKIGTKARSENFPRRNRIISGLSMGTLVIEAAQRSGSLITARLASEQGREIFAIPGSIHNPLARGCHRLIREGAKLVETAQDVLEELGPMLSISLNTQASKTSTADQQASHNNANNDMDGVHAQVLAAIGYDPTTMDSILDETRIAPETVAAALTFLELDGHITTETGGYYVLIK